MSTTYDWAQKKEPEKTWPVNIGAVARRKVLSIVTKIHGDTGHLVTQRSIVEKAISDLYAQLIGEYPPPNNTPTT